MSQVKTHTKIKILLEGELDQMDSQKVQSWFKEAFEWVEAREYYILAAKLRDAKIRWENKINQQQKQHEHQL